MQVFQISKIKVFHYWVSLCKHICFIPLYHNTSTILLCNDMTIQSAHLYISYTFILLNVYYIRRLFSFTYIIIPLYLLYWIGQFILKNVLFICIHLTYAIVLIMTLINIKLVHMYMFKIKTKSLLFMKKVRSCLIFFWEHNEVKPFSIIYSTFWGEFLVEPYFRIYLCLCVNFNVYISTNMSIYK